MIRIEHEKYDELQPKVGYIFVNNGSLLTNLVVPKGLGLPSDILEIEDGEYVPSPSYEEDDTNSLKELKSNQVLVSKNNLAKYLEEHPLLSYAHNKEGGLYAVDIDHQNRLSSNITSYQIAQMLGQEDCITWNETGKSCEVWKVEEALQLSLEIKTYVRPLISLQQHMEEDIMKCETQEEVLNVNIEFTDDVINDYRVKFNDMIEDSLNNK